MNTKEIISKEEADMLLSDEFIDNNYLDNSNDGLNEYISRILDVELELSIVLGRTKMKLDDVLNLGKGSLIELDTYKDQDVEILVGDKVLAYGKVVVVDLNFGVKITNIIRDEDLVKSLI